MGKPIYFNGIPLYSPTIDEICDIGEIRYHVYLACATFNVEAIFKYLLEVKNDVYLQLNKYDAYQLFTSVDGIINLLLESFSFFTKEQVVYDKLFSIFKINDRVFVSKDNYKEIASIIKEQNGIIEDDDISKQKFKNEKAKEMFLKRKRYREFVNKKNANNSLSLKDMLSVLCNAEGNGINVFNVGKLTIYQVYEHFDRLQIKEHHMRLLRVWANGYLKEGQQLPEWIVNGKF